MPSLIVKRVPEQITASEIIFESNQQLLDYLDLALHRYRYVCVVKDNGDTFTLTDRPDGIDSFVLAQHFLA